MQQQIELESLLKAILAKDSERPNPLYRAGHQTELFCFQTFENQPEAEPACV